MFYFGILGRAYQMQPPPNHGGTCPTTRIPSLRPFRPTTSTTTTTYSLHADSIHEALACLGGHPVEAVFETSDETLANRQVPTSWLETISLGFTGLTERMLP